MSEETHEGPDTLVEDLIAKRDAHLATAEEITSAAVAETRAFTEDEVTARAEALSAADAVTTQIDAITEDRARQAKAAESRLALGLGGQSTNDTGIRVGNEPKTYERHNGVSYFQDVIAMAAGPASGLSYFSAQDRLRAHANEIKVDAEAASLRMTASRTPSERYLIRAFEEATSVREQGRAAQTRADSTASGSGGEFVPPMYLTEDWIPFARAGRVVADACHKEDLPGGTMSINIPKVTGGTAVAAQGTQNTAVTETDITTAYVTAPVTTQAGAQTVSLQLLERSPIAFDEVIFKDLALALAQDIDNVVIAAIVASATGQTWTQASPTAGGFQGQVALASATVATARFLPATHAFTTPKRWQWLAQSLDTTGRPFVVPEANGPFNAFQTGPDGAVAEGIIGGKLHGLDTFEDANIPSNLGSGTNQDEVIVSRMDDNWLFESPIVTRALPQTLGANLSVLLQLYEYIAFTSARYPTASVVISGTGLVAPTFNS